MVQSPHPQIIKLSQKNVTNPPQAISLSQNNQLQVSKEKPMHFYIIAAVKIKKLEAMYLLSFWKVPQLDSTKHSPFQ